MTWRRHLLDFSGASAASFIATATDGLLFLVLLYTAVEGGLLSVGVAAGLGAFIGGIVHYLLSRFWVFRRFRAPIVRSAVTYFSMSWLAALFHGLATGYLAGSTDAKIAWFLSKGVVWILWTYPVSRYVVFGGLGRRDEADVSNHEDVGPER